MSSGKCGRYSLIDPAGARRDLFRDPNGSVPEPNAHIVPGTEVLAGGRSAEGRIRAALLHWGFPSDRSGPSDLVISARAESVGRNPAFRESFQRRRCLVAADSFYEWGTPEEGPQVAWRFRAADSAYLAFAGIYRPLRPANGGASGPVTGCVIVSTAASPVVARVHGRMPAVIAPTDFRVWLDPDTPVEELHDMLRGSYVDLRAEELAPVS